MLTVFDGYFFSSTKWAGRLEAILNQRATEQKLQLLKVDRLLEISDKVTISKDSFITEPISLRLALDISLWE